MIRNEFFAGLFFLGCANGLAEKVNVTLRRMGWVDAATGMFDISAIVLAACAAGLWFTMRPGKQSVNPTDLAVGGIALALIALPVGALSWFAVSGLALYILAFTNADASVRRGAIILLAMTVPVLWSRLLFRFFANFILEIDASLVGWLVGTDRTGNMVMFARDGGYLVILSGCSSLANMSIAFLCWITVSEWAEHRRSINDLWWYLLACGSVLVINVGRMSMMGLSLQHYEALHSPVGDAVTHGMILVTTLGWSLLGVRRELFARA